MLFGIMYTSMQQIWRRCKKLSLRMKC